MGRSPERMSERALAVSVGVPFDVEFDAPGAGYEWQLTAPPPGIELISRIFRNSGTKGENAQQLFHLRAREARRYELTFMLRSRSEGAPARIEIVAVEAHDSAA